MPALDRGKLLVTRRAAPGESGDGIGIDVDLFGDMVEHNRRQHLAAPKVATWVA